jgi:pimeloyl-ACP methyl ester carboxylesterase
MLFLLGEGSAQRERFLDLVADRTGALFRTAQVVTLPGVGHMMHHEDPQAVAASIINFAQAHP